MICLQVGSHTQLYRYIYFYIHRLTPLVNAPFFCINSHTYVCGVETFHFRFVWFLVLSLGFLFSDFGIFLYFLPCPERASIWQ